MLRVSSTATGFGPSSTADPILLAEQDGETRALFGIPGIGRGEGFADRGRETLFAVAAPGLVRRPSSGRPAIAFTLILDRLQVPPDAESIDALITGAVLTMDVGVAARPEELEQVNSDEELSLEPLFIRRTRWHLFNEQTDETLAELTGEGSSGSISLSETLDRKDALAVLAALRGEQCDLVLACIAEFRGTGTTAERSDDPLNAANSTAFTFTSSSMAELGSIKLRNPLHDLFAESNTRAQLDQIVKAVGPSPDGKLQDLASDSGTARSSHGPKLTTGLAAIGDSVAAMPVVLKTSQSAKVNAHSLAISGLANRLGNRLNRWQLADVILHPLGSDEQRQHLPVIEAEAPLWPDRIDANRYWYAPDFQIRMPQPVDNEATSPFRFSFSVLGHDGAGRPVLQARIKVTLTQVMPAAARTAWDNLGQPACDPVPTDGLTVQLILPFADESGAPARTSISASAVGRVEEGYEALFCLTDRFARLAYGVLSTPSFQSTLAQVETSYCFPSYVPVGSSKGRVVWGGKSAVVAPPAKGRPLGAIAALGVSSIHSQLLTAQPNIVAAHPVMVEPAIFIRPKVYGIRTQGRTQALDLFIPCATYGQLYLEEADPDTATPARPIGCRDAWTLGQLTLRLYEPLAVDLGIVDPPYSIFASSQVPGRFLIVPKAYTLTRYEPSDARAGRPAIYFHSNVDAVHPEKTSCLLTGTLRPSVTPAQRAALYDALDRAAHPNPILEWPTDIAAEPSFSWALPGGPTLIAPSAVQTPEGFQFGLGASIDHVLTLRSLIETSGITGAVTFALDDGTTVRSSMAIDLSRIDGPWEAGAVTASVAAGVATLVNTTGVPADVREVHLYQGERRTAVVPVERRVDALQRIGVDIPVVAADRALVDYTLVPTPTNLEEIRTFVEDIHTNVVFVPTFDLSAQHVDKILIEAQISGSPGAGTTELTAADGSSEIAFVLPLTAYLTQPTLRFRTTARWTDGTARTGAWRDWRLDLQGNVVEITNDMIKEG